MLDAAQFQVSVICYSLATELVVFCIFLAKAAVLEYPSHKCDGFEQFTLVSVIPSNWRDVWRTFNLNKIQSLNDALRAIYIGGKGGFS